MVEDMNELNAKIKKANKNWNQRTRGNLHDVQYDADADILYVTFGTPVESFSIPAEGQDQEMIYIRVSIDSYEIVGMDIHSFRHVFLPNHRESEEKFQAPFAFLGDEDGKIVLYKPASRPPLEFVTSYISEAVPDLVSA